MDARVLCFVNAVWSLVHDLRVGAKHVVEPRVRLPAQLIAIHQKQCPLELPTVREELQQSNCNAGFARACSQRQHSARTFRTGLRERRALQHRTDSDILNGFPSRISMRTALCSR